MKKDAKSVKVAFATDGTYTITMDTTAITSEGKQQAQMVKNKSGLLLHRVSYGVTAPFCIISHIVFLFLNDPTGFVSNIKNLSINFI